MESSIKRLTEVWTADDKRLGLAKSLYHRESGADPALKLYPTCMEVASFDYGDDFYIPTTFIAAYDQEMGRVTLAVSLQKVLENTWSRLPDFVASGKARKEELAAG